MKAYPSYYSKISMFHYWRFKWTDLKYETVSIKPINPNNNPIINMKSFIIIMNIYYDLSINYYHLQWFLIRTLPPQEVDIMIVLLHNSAHILSCRAAAETVTLS